MSDDCADTAHTALPELEQCSDAMLWALCSQHIYMLDTRVPCPYTNGEWISYLPTALLDL